MADQDPQPDEPAAWDRVGQMFGDMAGVTERISNRNLGMWTSVSNHLRQGKYTADDLATDTARVWSTAMDNLDDMWTFWTRVPERQRVAADLPTAFMYFAWKADAPKVPTHGLADPVWIRIPPGLTDPPPTAKIAVAGTTDEGSKALENRLRVTLGKAGNAYKLESYGAEEEFKLIPGAYSGAVFLTGPVRPLANVRAIVQRKPN